MAPGWSAPECVYIRRSLGGGDDEACACELCLNTSSILAVAAALHAGAASEQAQRPGCVEWFMTRVLMLLGNAVRVAAAAAAVGPTKR